MEFAYVYGENVAAKYPYVSVSIERITPEVALIMLEANVKNRAMKREPIKDAILSGEWKLNGSPIVFSADGVLLDGQNRLRACIDSGVPIDTFVVRGIEPLAQTTIDVGAKRTLSDWVKMNGYPNANMVAAIAVKLAKAEKLGVENAFITGRRDDPTLSSMVAFVEESYETRLKPIVNLVRPLMHQYKNVSAGTWGVLFEQFKNSVSFEDFNEFYEQLSCRKTPCKSVLLLITKLQTNSRQTSSGKLPQKTIAALVIKAFNAYMRGDEPKVLSYKQGGASRDSFPVIYSDKGE